MATGILIVLTVVLVAAACYVGLLLLRRSRPAQDERTPTVGDLVRRRSTASDDLSGADDTPGADDLSGSDLFTPKDPRAVAAVSPRPDGASPSAVAASTADVAIPHLTSPPAATPPGGVEVGDAPWRRAARMMGSEPGGAWETAPIPEVAPAEPGPDPAADRAEAGRTAVMTVPAPPRVTPDEPRPAAPAAVPEQADAPAEVAPAEVAPPEVAPPEAPLAPALSPDLDAPSRPLSDPDLTPLMGIPIIRPLAETPIPTPAVAAAVAEPEPVTQPVVTPRLSRPSVIDDEVVSMRPATTSLPRAAVTGSPQPVWFRVVRRDGEPVGGVLVTLLDDQGQEADATKTATDGGGELHAPHGGWFLMIASADGFQPRAVTLAVDEQPVEIALLLPRSATVAGVVRADGAAAPGTRVVAFQEGEVVDELVTDRDGGYRFDDLAEGVYALSACGARGSAVGRLTLSEGADGQLDLDLRRADGAR